MKDYQNDLRRLRCLLFLAIMRFFFPLLVLLTAEVDASNDGAAGSGEGRSIFALVKGCGWDNGEGLSDFKKQLQSKIRRGKLAFWDFAGPSSQNKTRPPWRSRGWEGRMRHIRGAGRG